MLFPQGWRKATNKKTREIYLPGGKVKDMIPNDPVMLLSFINLKLRDFYGSLDALCEDLDVDRKSIEEKLEGIDYRYDVGKNQFV